MSNPMRYSVHRFHDHCHITEWDPDDRPRTSRVICSFGRCNTNTWPRHVSNHMTLEEAERVVAFDALQRSVGGAA